MNLCLLSYPLTLSTMTLELGAKTIGPIKSTKTMIGL